MVETDETVGRARPGGLEVPPELQRAWLCQLREFFALYNCSYLDFKLKTTLFRLDFESDRLGQWDGANRTISISVRHILSHPWGRVMETLRHEMAHMYAEEVLGAGAGEPAHGPAFQEACRLLRVDPFGSASEASLGTLEASSAERDKILSRVKLLLALAKSPNEHEAANAMRMANRYLLKYNLELVEAGRPRNYVTRQLGTCRARVQEYEYVLARILQDHFFVEVIWAMSYDPLRNVSGSVLEVCGTRANVEMAEHAYRFVMNFAERSWEHRKRSGGATGGTKLQYLSGLIEGFYEKLNSQRNELAQEYALVWRGDSGLKEYFRYMHPHVCSVRVRGVSRNEVFESGRREGRRLTIHRPLGGASGGGGAAGALPPAES